jgi:hypothetical protein
MKIELKTRSLYEIIQKANANNLDIKKVKIESEVYELISYPGESHVRLYIKGPKK